MIELDVLSFVIGMGAASLFPPLLALSEFLLAKADEVKKRAKREDKNENDT